MSASASGLVSQFLACRYRTTYPQPLLSEKDLSVSEDQLLFLEKDELLIAEKMFLNDPSRAVDKNKTLKALLEERPRLFQTQAELLQTRFWNRIIFVTCIALPILLPYLCLHYFYKMRPNADGLKKNEEELRESEKAIVEEKNRIGEFVNEMQEEKRAVFLREIKKTVFLRKKERERLGQIREDAFRWKISIDRIDLCINPEDGQVSEKANKRIQKRLHKVKKELFDGSLRRLVDCMGFFHQGIFVNAAEIAIKFLQEHHEERKTFIPSGNSGNPKIFLSTEEKKLRAFSLFDIKEFDEETLQWTIVNGVAIRVFIEVNLQDANFQTRQEVEIVRITPETKRAISVLPLWEVPQDASTWEQFVYTQKA